MANNQQDRSQNQHDADGEAGSEEAVEDEDGDADCGDGFEGADNGRGGGTGVLDADVEHRHRDDGRDDGHHTNPTESCPTRDGHDAAVGHAEGIESDDDRREGHDVEGHLEGRHGDVRAVHHDDIDGVGERGNQHQDDTPQRHFYFTIALIEQQYSYDTQHNRDYHHRGSTFLEENRHDDRYHHGIGKQDGGSDPGIEVFERGV